MRQAHVNMGGVSRITAAMQPNDVQGEEPFTCGHAWGAQNDSSHAARLFPSSRVTDMWAVAVFTESQQPCSQMISKQQIDTPLDICVVHRMTAAMQPDDLQGAD